MLLTETTIQFSKTYHGHQSIDNLAAAKHIKIETLPSGDEILDAVVPTDKIWDAYILITIRERDA